ncbi:hypothetical protein HY025_04080 [Candidatus Daviesbacteria bacterium]|nr:hypothetical protein [Candidatus Daviesbacteria bacterium]
MLKVNLPDFFSSQKLWIVIFLIIIIAIPTGAFLIKQRRDTQNNTLQQNYNKTVTKDSTSSAKEVPKNLPIDVILNGGSDSSNSASASQTPAAQINFGPTLNFKVNLEGRPASNQATSNMFVGIAAGSIPTTNPQYLLTFTVPIGADGSYSGLSLAGLTIGNTYLAYLKGPAQIASSSAFVVQPASANLNSGTPLTLLTGDLNEDNIINSLDYGLAKNNFGTTSSSANWNANMDFNLDGIINVIDLGYIRKNLNKVGDGNLYISRVSTTSAILNQPSQGGVEGGYWMWFPKF